MRITINIIANWITTGYGMSGGDRIFIECARRWAKDEHKINIFTNECGLRMCDFNNLKGVNYHIWPSEKYNKLGIYIAGIIRTIKGIFYTLRYRPLDTENTCIVYSSSDFLPDSIPGFIMSRRMKNSKWIAGFYLFAPNPFKGFNEKTPRIKDFIYYLYQIPVYWLVKRYSDMVFVTSEPDVEKFITKDRKSDKIVVIRGGVDLKTPSLVSEPEEKKYDAVFIGRFHPQKGVLELVEIWKLVCIKKPNSRLVIIGEGPLEGQIKEKVRMYGLNNNIDFVGFKDGIEKIKIFKSSKLVVHPAIYDSGGMAACEAMACGLPGVSFDLEALKTYYPKGMIKTPCYDFEAFADNILKLLEDYELYVSTRRDAIDLAKEWDWERRGKEILEIIKMQVCK